MKAFRFDAEALVKRSGIKREFGVKQGSGYKKDTGFARPRKGHTKNPGQNFSHQALPVAA
ncbi:MAG: hypothetical protein ABSC63_05620 [Candidatus Binataceae bacterium]|jgi:hypothetical protein